MAIDKAKLVQVLAENGATAPEVDTDTLADRIIAFVADDADTPAETGPETGHEEIAATE